ncbi:hypothetical protein FG386_000113 [Cryptosporidium ryanae]|uniref:uncharacterized protein n=1 Tax=Cryptosporidium ryanae TaxID=515981 RepID=UPI00351A555C|nr:hypothetical protein FG386_000113 [Cryptosporidium ryanae]
MEKEFSECLEICFYCNKIPNIFLKILKIFLKAHLFIPECDENQNEEHIKIIIEKYVKRNEIIGAEFNEYVVFKKFTSSIIPSPLSIDYIIGKKNMHASNDCNFSNNLITLHAGKSTSISKIEKYMHVIFILDLSSLLMNTDYFKFDEFLNTWINGSLLKIESILVQVNELVLIHNENICEEYKIKVKFSLLLFGIESEKSWFQILINEVNLLDVNLSIDHIKNYLLNEIVQLFDCWERNDNTQVLLNEETWNQELIEYLSSLCNFYSNSVVVITNGVIISKITGERGSSVLSLGTDIIKYCFRFDIKLHFIIMEELETDLESELDDYSIEKIQSIDVFNFIANSCNSILVRTNVKLNDESNRKIALELVYSSISDLKPLCNVETSNHIKNRTKIFEYKIEKNKTSLIELIFNRINNGFKLINGEFQRSLPILTISQFNKLVRIGSLIDNCDGDLNEHWVVTFFVEANTILDINDFEFIKGKLGNRNLMVKSEKFTKYNKKNYLIKKILYYIEEIYVLDNIFGILTIESGFERSSMKLSEFTLPYTIRLSRDLILEEDNYVFFKEKNDFFESSWKNLIEIIRNLGFKLFYLSEDINAEDYTKINESEKIVYFKTSNKLELINTKKYKDINIWSVLKSWENTKISELNNVIQRNLISNYIIWLVIKRFSTHNNRSTTNGKIKTSMVRLELLFYGYNPEYCNDYFDSFISKVKSAGSIVTNKGNLGLLKISFNCRNSICYMSKSLVKTKSWSYLLWTGSNDRNNITSENSNFYEKNNKKGANADFENNDSYKSKIASNLMSSFKNKRDNSDNENSKNYLKELEYSSLNNKIISTISHSRQIDGWSLFFKRKNKEEFCSNWFKFVDKKADNFSSKSVFVYEISIGFEKEKNGMKLTCKLYMLNSLSYSNHNVYNTLFSKYANVIQSQDDRIIHTTSLIEYLYKSSHLRKKEVTYYSDDSILVLKRNYYSNFSTNKELHTEIDNENIDNIKNMDYDNIVTDQRNQYLSIKKNRNEYETSNINTNDISSIDNSNDEKKDVLEMKTDKFSKIGEKVDSNINRNNGYEYNNNKDIKIKNLSSGELKNDSPSLKPYYNNKKNVIMDINKTFNYKKYKEVNINKRVIQQKSSYCGNNRILLTIRDISALFLTYYNYNLLQSKCSNYRHIVIDNTDLSQDFINYHKPLYLIEIPLINVDYINSESFISFSKRKDSELLKKYIEGASESSFKKFLYKLSKIIDKSVRIDDNEWYMILFVDENELFGNIDESSKYNSINENILKKVTRTNFSDFIIITHIKLLKSNTNVLKKSTISIYFCSYKNLSYGVTNKRDDFNLNFDYKKTLKIKIYIELFASKVRDIWNLIKFKTISRYYLQGIPICAPEVAKIQIYNKISTDESKNENGVISLVVNFNIDSKCINNEIITEECKYLSCKTNNIIVNLDNFRNVLQNKYSYCKNSIYELNKFAIYMETELEFRIRNILKLKLINFEDVNLSNFIIFCGLLQLSKGKNENIIIIVSLLENKNNVNLNQDENRQFWIENTNNELNEQKNRKLNWFHYLISYYLVNNFNNGSLELKITFYSSIDKEYNNDRLTNIDMLTIVNYIRDDFIVKFKKIFVLWIVEMTIELSIIHKNSNIIKNNFNLIESFSYIGRDILLEGFFNSKKIDWRNKDVKGDNVNLIIEDDNNGYQSSSVVYYSDIQITMLNSSTKYSNYMTIFNLLSSLLDYIPLKREPNLILLWQGHKIQKETFISNIAKYNDKIDIAYINDIINHMRVIVEIFEPCEIEEKLLKIRMNIYLPSSLLSGKYLSVNKRFKCKLCDFIIYKGQFEGIISFLFSITQKRFLDLWKDATCDFLLQNVTILRKVSSLIIPTFISSDESIVLRNNDKKLNNEVSMLYSKEQVKVFGPITQTDTSLYEIPSGLTPNYYKINYNNLNKNTLKNKKLSPYYYEKPGKVILWDGGELEIPTYTFWLNKYDEIYIEIPCELYDVPLIDCLFKLDSNLTFNEGIKSENNYYFKTSFNKLSQKKELQNISDNTFINLIHPKYWSLYSEDVTTFPVKLGIGSLFLIKPDYKLIDATGNDNSYSEINYNYYNTLVKKKQKICLSLSFFGKRRPTKNTRIYFYKYLRLLIKNFLQSWKSKNKKSLTGVIINNNYNIDSFREYRINNKTLNEKENKHSTKQQVSLIFKFNSIYHNYVSILVWNTIKSRTILFDCESLYAIIKKILIEFGIEFSENEKGIQINIEFLQSDSVNSDTSNCKINLSLFSGINGYILNKNDPWAGGEKMGDKCLNLDPKSRDCFLKLNSDDINKLTSNFWDFDNILELIYIEKSNENISNNSLWNIIRGSDKRISQIQNNLPINLLNDQSNSELKESSVNVCENATTIVYMMPCIYVGVDIDYNNIGLNDVNKEIYDNFRINSSIEFTVSLLNILLLESLLKFRIIMETDSTMDNKVNYYGKTIGDIHRYRENMHNCFKLLIKYRNIIERYSRKTDIKICDKETFMNYFSTPTIKLIDSKTGGDTKTKNDNSVKIYLPSWSIIDLLMKVKNELFLLNERQIEKNQNIFECIVSGYTLIIHDNREIDIMNEIIYNTKGTSNNYIQIKYLDSNLNDEKRLINEHGWHILHYKSELNYINLDKMSGSEIENWLDLLYKNDKEDGKHKNANDFNIFESIFNLSGGKQRPCIALHIHSNDEKGLLNNILFIDVNPDSVLFMGWDIPLFVKERINELIKEYFYSISTKVILYYQLIIWNNYCKLYDKKYIIAFDLSPLINSEKRAKLYSELEHNYDSFNTEQIKVMYKNPKICGIPLRILSKIWDISKNCEDNTSYYFKFPKDLYIRETKLIFRINRIKVEDVIIPNIETGRVLDLLVDESMLNGNKLMNYPSTISLVIKLNLLKLIKRWCNYYLKYQIWMNVFQFVLDNFSVRMSNEFSRVYKRSIISQSIENYQMDYNKFFYIDNDVITKNNLEKQTYYSVLLYLQNSHSNLKNYINRITKNERDHNLILHPDRIGTILPLSSKESDTEDDVIDYCKLCSLYPENTSLRLILINLFKFSQDIINVALIKRSNVLIRNYQEKDHEIREEKILINKTWYKRSFTCYNSPENRSKLCLFSENIENFLCINNNYNKSTYHIKYIIKELLSKLDDYLEEMSFIRLKYSCNGNIGNHQKHLNEEEDHHISIVKSILNGLDISFSNDEFNTRASSAEALKDIDDSIYLNTINIIEHNITIPFCLMIKICDERVEIVYILSSCCGNDCNEEISNSLVNNMLNYIEILNLRRVVYDFIMKKTVISLVSIWNSRNCIYLYKNYGDISDCNNTGNVSIRYLNNSIDQFIDSIYWINRLYKNIGVQNGELVVPLYKVSVKYELRLTHNQITTIQSNILTSNKLLQEYSFRIISLPNTKNIVFILFKLLDRDSLVGIMMGGEYDYSDYYKEDFGDYQILCFELADNFALSPYSSSKNASKKNMYENNKINLLGYENVKNEVIELLERLHEYINRERELKLMKICDSDFNKKNVYNITNSYFSKTVNVESRYINSLPVLKIKISDKNKMESILYSNSIVNSAIYTYYKYWKKKKILGFNSFKCNSENERKIQNRLISILLPISLNSNNYDTLVLMNMYTKFTLGDENNILDWVFEDIKLTYKDEVNEIKTESKRQQTKYLIH